MAAESNPVSENYGIESNNYSAIDIVQWDERGKYSASDVGGIWDCLTLKALN